MDEESDGETAVFRLSRDGKRSEKVADGAQACGTTDKTIVFEYDRPVVRAIVGGRTLRADLKIAAPVLGCAATDFAAYVSSVEGIWRTDWTGRWTRVDLPFNQTDGITLAPAGGGILVFVGRDDGFHHLVVVPFDSGGTGPTIEAELEGTPAAP